VGGKGNDLDRGGLQSRNPWLRHDLGRAWGGREIVKLHSGGSSSLLEPLNGFKKGEKRIEEKRGSMTGSKSSTSLEVKRGGRFVIKGNGVPWAFREKLNIRMGQAEAP